MKQLLSIRFILLLVLVLAAGCGGDHKSTPDYRAHIVDMQVSGATTTTAAAPMRTAILSGVTTTTQDFYSGDISITTSYLGVDLTVQNDSDISLNLMIMTYWAPADYPYPDTWVDHSLIEWCGGYGRPLEPGEIVTITLNNSSNAWNDTSLLGPQQFSAYAYVAESETSLQNVCQPSPWDGTLQGMIDYINTHPPLATATNHFTMVQ